MMTRIIIFICLGLIIVINGDDKLLLDCGPCKCAVVVAAMQTVDCENTNLTEIPEHLSPAIQFLNLNKNPITNLPKEVFKNASLLNLQRIYMRNCNITNIHRDAFKDLSILKNLDLSENHIKQLLPGIFSSTIRLRTLLLNNNNLEELDEGVFYNLIYLQKIELFHNNLRKINEKAFKNVTDLSTITLNDNNLTYIKLSTFENLSKLTSLDLKYNPWNCDCHMKKFHDWMIKKKLYTDPLTCHKPEVLSGKKWIDIKSDEFSCPPKIESIGIESVNNDYIELGDTVTISCHAKGLPKPNIVWIHRTHILHNLTKRSNDKYYILKEAHEWLNLTLNDITLSDKGEYICKAHNYGGSIERNITISIVGDGDFRQKTGIISLPVALGLGIVLLILFIFLLTLCTWYCRKRKNINNEKIVDTSLEHQSLGEQEKSLITAINPVVKPPRRYEAPSVTSHGTEMTELNRTLIDNDSVFADGMGSIMGVVGGTTEDERDRATSEIENGTLTCVPSYRQYPPDLLAFSGGRGASPISQTSTIPDTTLTTATSSSRLPINQQHLPYSGSIGQYPAVFKTLPHSHRTGSTYSNNNSPIIPVLPRHTGYVTIPRRPRAPSWSSALPGSPGEINEPVYDNLGMRITANGSSVLSLNKSPEPGPISMRIRPLPNTPIQTSHHSLYHTNINNNALSPTPLDKSSPEETNEWFNKLSDDIDNRIQSDGSNTLGRKIPPRPPPKPKKKSNNGPLYEDEGEDGTEV